MTMKRLLGAGAALALVLAAAPAMAQSFDLAGPPPPSGAPPGAPASVGTGPVGTSATDIVLVRGTPEELGARRGARPPDPVRPFVPSDDLTQVTRGDWIAAGWSEESFNNAELRAQQVCRQTGMWVARATILLGEYAERDPRLMEIYGRYYRLGNDIVWAGRVRTGTNVFYGVIGWFAGPWMGAPMTAGAIGNEAQGRTWDRSMMLNRDSGQLNTEYMMLHGEFSVLSLEMHIANAELVMAHCITVYGAGPAPADQDLLAQYRARFDFEQRYEDGEGRGRDRDRGDRRRGRDRDRR